jgi:DNA-directed RNA polymerase subunit beta'
VRDYECACGKYKRIKYKGVICDRCGVEVTVARVRRERMGHIELAVPCSHIWFLKSMPSRLGLLLDMTARNLERVIYYENYIVIDPGQDPARREAAAHRAGVLRPPSTSMATIPSRPNGCRAVREVLEQMDLALVVDELSRADAQHPLEADQEEALQAPEGDPTASSNPKPVPEWMVLEVLPVIPPDLRPLVPLEGGRFATSDLNDLYRRVINRNNRLKNLLS